MDEYRRDILFAIIPVLIMITLAFMLVVDKQYIEPKYETENEKLEVYMEEAIVAYQNQVKYNRKVDDLEDTTFEPIVEHLELLRSDINPEKLTGSYREVYRESLPYITYMYLLIDAHEVSEVLDSHKYKTAYEREYGYLDVVKTFNDLGYSKGKETKEVGEYKGKSK